MWGSRALTERACNGTPRCKAIGLPLDHASPTEVGRQVLGCDAVEGTQPAIQAAHVGVDVLDVIDAVDHVVTLRGDNGDVLDASLARETAVDLGSV